MFGNQHDPYFRHNATKLSCGDIVGKSGNNSRIFFSRKPGTERVAGSVAEPSSRHIAIDASGAEPSIVVGLQLDDVTAVLVGAAVVGRKQIDEFAGASITANGSAVEHDGAWLSR